MSLGWCFWHAGCFGCLLCGQPLGLDFKELDESLGYGRRSRSNTHKTGNKMRDEIEEVRQGRKRKALAIELDEIPVCRGCDIMLVETGAHREEVGMFLGRSNVGQHDGGLGEARWKKLRRTHTDMGVPRSPRGSLRAQSPSANSRKLADLFERSEEGNVSGVSHLPRLSIGDTDVEQGSNKTVTPSRRRPRRRATEGQIGSHAFESECSNDSTMGRDGSHDSNASYQFPADDIEASSRSRNGSNDSYRFNADEIEANFPRAPRPPPVMDIPPPDVNPIYVSITDPINGPSFRPSPTKPIPRWMALLPSQRSNRSPERSPNRTREPSIEPQIVPKAPFDWSAYRRSLHGSLDSEVEESIHTPAPPAPLPSPSEYHPAPHLANSSTSSLPTIPESARKFDKDEGRRPSHAQSMTGETVYFTLPEHPCDFFQKAIERRLVKDEHGLEKVQRSLKKGSLKEGHELYHRRNKSEASECLAEIISLPRVMEEREGPEVIESPIKVPAVWEDTRRLAKALNSGKKTGSNAEFIERYNLAIEEEDRRSKERARSIRGSLERIRGRGSVRRVISRAPPMEKEESEAAQSEEGDVTEEEKGQERLRRELKGIFKSRT